MARTTTQTDFISVVQVLAPRPIRKKKQLTASYHEFDHLMRLRRLSADERDYLELLSMLVEKYEAALVPLPEVPQGQMLAHLLESRNVTQAQVARTTGVSANLLSNVRAGRRELSKDNIRRLSKYFNVSPAVWL